MDNVPGPAKTIHDLQAEIERYKAEYGELSAGVEQVANVAALNGDTVIDVTSAATPVPVSENFAGVDISAQKNTPTDAIAVLALRVNDLEQRFQEFSVHLGKIVGGNTLGEPSQGSVAHLIDHLYSVLGFRKPDADGNG